MIDIKVTVNGKPFTKTNFESEIEKVMFSGLVEAGKGVVLSSLEPEEASQISINYIGTKVDDLSLEVLGPEEIVKKVELALAEQR